MNSPRMLSEKNDPLCEIRGGMRLNRRRGCPAEDGRQQTWRDVCALRHYSNTRRFDPDVLG